MSDKIIPDSVQAISFDLDDTLWSTNQVISHAERTMENWMAQHTPLVSSLFSPDQMREKKLSFIQKNPQLVNKISLARQTFLHQLFQELGYEHAAKLAKECFHVFYEARQQVILFDDVLASLGQLKKDYRLIAITNGNADVSKTPLKEVFEFSLVAEDFSKPKPHNEIFDHALERLDCDAESVLHVGDHPIHDMQGAYEIGMHTCWLDDGTRAWDLPFDAHMRIEHVRDLLTNNDEQSQP